jgi:hypothetical protein
MVFSLFVSALFWACSAAPAATKENAQVVLQPPVTRGSTVDGVYQEHLQSYTRTAIFLLGTKYQYSIDSRGGWDASDPEKPFTPGQGGFCMGMPGPVATGWYCYGFLNIIINGQEASTTMLGSMTISEQGRRAMVDMVWHIKAADVRIRVLGLPGRDFLFFEMTVDPKQKINSLELKALCYPAYFTSFYGQREQARFVQTPSLLLREAEHRGRSVPLAPNDNWWLLYGDEFFDVAKTRESEGPCALLMLPEDAASITVNEVGYGVTTTVSVVPEARKIRMAFWKMVGQTNAEAADYFRANGEKIRRELAALDFTPEPIKTLDLAGMSAEIERVARSATVGAEFQERAAELLVWIKDHSANLADQSDRVNATESKLQLLDQYEGFVYEARLAEMLAFMEK